jgi:hypothetical protein
MKFFCAAASVSILSGLFTATWGAFKDAPYERFSHRSFWRSLGFSLAILVVLFAIGPLRAEIEQLQLVEVFFLVMGLERIAIEIYKPCFRREDQAKYLIPQDFSFFGVHLASPASRAAIGLALIAGTLGVAGLATEIGSAAEHLLVATLTGLVICIGGAGKDAPYEGFQPRKFLRSAIVLAVVSPAFYALGTRPLGLLIFMYGGLIVEAYKTYFTPHPPGKFRRDLPIIDRRFLQVRPVLRVVALAIVLAVGALYAGALT